MKAIQLLTNTEPPDTPVRIRSDEEIPLSRWLHLEQHRWKNSGHQLDTAILRSPGEEGGYELTLVLVDIEPNERFSLRDPFIVSIQELQEIESGTPLTLNDTLRIKSDN